VSDTVVGSTSAPHSLPFRLVQLIVGLTACAVGIWLSVQAGLGLAPWDVLHSGLSARLNASYGHVIIGLGLLVLVASALLGERPGVGTLLNILVIGSVVDLLFGTPWLDGLADASLGSRAVALVLSVVVLAVARALYIGAHLGAGPRDSLMVGLHARYGVPIGVGRSGVEVAVLLLGLSLGGAVGVGTVVLAVSSGPSVALAFRLLRQTPRPAPAPA
jgi:uncharacterized membrane protein YczE